MSLFRRQSMPQTFPQLLTFAITKQYAHLHSISENVCGQIQITTEVIAAS